jgi:hypothetical protein
MKNHWRILFLLALALVLTATGNVSASKPGLICGTPDDPIPCSTFNTSTCTYTLDRAANCCDPSIPSPSCLGICC